MSRVKSFFKRRIKSFGYAFNGLWYVIRTQTNFQIHLVATAAVVAAGFYFRISASEWLVLVLTIGFVLVAETVNTIVEKIMDFVSPEFNKTVGLIKDLSAAAVLLTALVAVTVGLIIFLPKLLTLF